MSPLRPTESAGASQPADERVRSRAATRLGASYLLEAGAGTGKTTVLLSRVTEFLKTNVPLDRIAVITFTDEAAGELKLKLRRRMEEMLAGSGADTGWGAHLKRSLESLDRATVSTIHAFAASLLRERPVEANVDPGFTVADRIASSMLLEETWERWIEAEMAAGTVPLARALRLGLTLKQIRRLAFEIVRHRDVDPLGAGAPPAGDLDSARDRIVEAIAHLKRLSASCTGDVDEGLRQIRALEAGLPALQSASGDRLLLRLGELPLKGNAGSQKNWRPEADLAQVKTLISELAKCRDEACLRERSVLAHEMAGWLRDGFQHAYRSAKEARRLLDFTDMLIICRNMLRDKRDARLALQQRFDCLLVDEFQDTDPLQVEILFLLAAEDPEVADWRLARPRPGKLFVVGDPKQSIYRFRRADIEVYEEAKALIRAAGGTTHEALTQNFRTVPSIVSWVNDLFERLIQPQAGSRSQPAYEKIQAYREEPRPARARGKGASSRVILLMPEGSGSLASEDGAHQVRMAEARHVAAFIRTAVAERWLVSSRDTAESRDLRYRDIALLFRTSTAFEIYEEVFRESAIPYRIAGGKRYYMRAEMRALQAVLEAIESPHDPLAVVSALRCPIFGYSDEELLTYAAAGGDWAYTRPGEERGTPFEKAFELLRALHASRNRRSVAATLEEIFEATGALALFYLKPDGEQRTSNLLKALDLARAHESAGTATFGSFTRWLKGMAVDEREEAEAPLSEVIDPDASEDENDAVRIFTVHKAKGLEFPMTVLCDPGGGTVTRWPVCVIERGKEAGAAPRMEYCLGSKENRLESSGYWEACGREKERLDAERLRLFYVAATRARDYLVIPAFGGKHLAGVYATMRDEGFFPTAPSGSRGGSETAALHRGARLFDGAALDTTPRQVRPLRISAADAVPSVPGLIAEKAGWRKALDLALTAPTMGREFRSASAMELAPASWVTDPREQQGRRRSRAIGEAVHAVLERIDLSTGRDIGLLCEEETAERGYLDLADEVRALVDRALKSRIVREALAAPRYFREMPFAAAGDAYLTEGRIDLAFESGGGLTLVDFKTDRVATQAEIAARVQAYRPQSMIYARALGQACGLSVGSVVLFFLRPGVEVALGVDESFLMAGRRLLETGAYAPEA